MTVPVLTERPKVAVPCGCTLGEGPVWDDRTGTLLWVDIEGQALWSWQPSSGRDARSDPLPERCGFVLLTPDPSCFVLGLKSGMARYRLGRSPETVLRPEPARPGNRLNDGAAGPDGSVYFGSLNDAGTDPTGAFYHWSASGLAGFGVTAKTTNGPAVDGPRGVLYATDTSHGRIHRHAIGPDGAPGPAELFVAFREGDGHPDGMAVDAEGHLWVCHFRGSRITCFAPDGSPVLIVPMPTPQVTKLCFGGPDLTTAYVTTAARDLDRTTDPLAGHVFSFEAGIAGLPASPCRVAGA